MNWLKKLSQIPFFNDCVHWPTNLVPSLEYIADPNNSEYLNREEFQQIVQSPLPPEGTPEFAVYAKLKGFDIYYTGGDEGIHYVFADLEAINKLQDMINSKRERGLVIS